jgi:UDP-N-acetylmuramate--alanine ligase
LDRRRHYGLRAMDEAPFDGRTLHLIGIGGAGMSGLALVATALGATVSGSDRADSPYCGPLRAAGIEPRIGHDAANVPAGAEVVVSTAIADDNPELVAARAAGARVLHRGELLGEITRLRPTIAVAGTHGKTTTASMVAHVLLACGRAPGFLIGGELRSAGTNAGWGGGEWIVVEADESDRSFLELRRDVAVVTNVELDHHATYRTLSDLTATFREFLAPARRRWLSEQAREALGGEDARIFGIAEAAPLGLAATDLALLPGGSRFVVEGMTVELAVPGRHNVLNALAALAACREAGVEPAEAAPALATFGGAGRRFERHGTTAAGALVVDDYAHHPTEVRATLEAARTLAPRRLIACFQPHLYSRTEMLAREFGAALALADLVVVLDVYPARERAEDFPGVSGLLVARAAADAARGRPVWWLPTLDAAAAMLRDALREGDLLLTLGAGDVDSLARRLTA